VPYYRELGARPGDFRDVGDLARLPLIEREQVQRDPEYFVSRARPIGELVEQRSAGTSGDPVTIFHDQRYLFRGAAHRQRRAALVAKLAGKRFRYRHLAIRPPDSAGERTTHEFGARTLISPSIRGPQKRTSMLNPFERTLELIDEFRPDVVSTFGSYAEALFVHLHETGRPFHRPRVVVYSSDALSEPVRRLITDDFGIEVIGFYGSIEAFHLGFECDRHRGFHLNDDLYPIRIVDTDGAPVPHGATGEVVVSNLVTRGTILLNYRLGDIATRLPERCPCGRTLPLLSLFGRRLGDWLESASGDPVHPKAVHKLLQDERDIWRFQLVERSRGDLLVSVVPKEPCDREAVRERLARGFGERLGQGTKIEVAFVDSLPRTHGGKVPPIVSRRGAG
jgi:phenylacetate-coenzyme A ligase PaaK-like adenylate-forming protein